MASTSLTLVAGAAASVVANRAGILLNSMGLKMSKETVHQQKWNNTLSATDEYANTTDAIAISTSWSISVNTTLWISQSVPESPSSTPTGKTAHSPPAPYPKTTAYPNMTSSPPHILPLKTMPLSDSPSAKETSSSNYTWHKPPTFNTAPWYPSKPSNKTLSSNKTWHAPTAPPRPTVGITGPSSYNTAPCPNATWHWPVPPPPKSTPWVPSLSSSESSPLCLPSSAPCTPHTPAPASPTPESESWSPTAYSPQSELWSSSMLFKSSAWYSPEIASTPLPTTTGIAPSPPSPATIIATPTWYPMTTSPALQPDTTVSVPDAPAAPVTVVLPSPLSTVPESPTNTISTPTASNTPLLSTSALAPPPESPSLAPVTVHAAKPVQPAPSASEAPTTSYPASVVNPVDQPSVSTYTQLHTTPANSSPAPSSSTMLLSSLSTSSSWTAAAPTSDADRVSPIQAFLGSLLFATACIFYVFA